MKCRKVLLTLVHVRVPLARVTNTFTFSELQILWCEYKHIEVIISPRVLVHLGALY